MSWFILVCYFIFAYGISIIFTNGVGPFGIFIKIRRMARQIGPLTELMFKCMMCFPANVGWVFSIFNWFCIPIAISPFNMILKGTNMWWLAAIMDACITSAVCHTWWNIDDYVDKNTPIFEDEQDFE